MFSKRLMAEAVTLSARCKARGITLVTAESCTGGLIAALLTEIPGSSAVFECGFVTYSNEAKRESLGVAAATLRRSGAVSPQVAKAMARGALTHSNATIALAVTGIAGPGGGTRLKPVGLVYISCAYGKASRVMECRFKGGRQRIRNASVIAALKLAGEMIAAKA